MATYANQSTDTLGTTITYAQVTAADRFLPNDRGFLHVKNASGNTITVTMVTPGVVDGNLTIQDRVITLLTGTERMIDIPVALYRSSDGLGDVQFAGTTLTGCTAAVVGV